MLLSILVFSQVEDGTLNSRYLEVQKWNGYEMESTYKGFMNNYIYFNYDYYIISLDGEEPSKVYWEYIETKNNMASYRLENGGIVIFSFDDPQMLSFYFDYNSSQSRHETKYYFTKNSFTADD